MNTKNNNEWQMPEEHENERDNERKQQERRNDKKHCDSSFS